MRRDSLNFTRRTEAALVEWLQENTWLYDKNQAMYRDRDRKDRAFEEKGRMLNPKVSGDDLKRWLASRRTQFGRITRKIGASGSGAPNLTEREKFVLKYFEFLRKHIIRHRDPPVLGLPQVIKKRKQNSYSFIIFSLMNSFKTQFVSNPIIESYPFLFLVSCDKIVFLA